MSVKSLIIIFLRRIRLLFKRKIHLNSDTILVNLSSWTKFNPSNYISDKDISVVPINQIHRDDYEKIIAYIGAVDKRILINLPRLQWLQIPSHGTNGYELASLYANKNVVVTRAADIFSESIAQYCITAYYVFNTFAFRRFASVTSSNHITGCDIVNEVSIAIIGLGNIGMCLAKKCHELNWKVYGVKKHIPSEVPNYIDGVFSFHEIKHHLNKFDYIVNLLPENTETIGLYNYDFFKLLKPNSIFCNVGRASSVVENDLVRAIKEGCLKGAVLDVVKDIREGNGIIVTPHISWKSENNDICIDKFMSAQLHSYLQGKDLRYKINLEC